MFVLPLDSAQCQDVQLVGAKAARLARARTLGFPVPDAVVLPCSASTAILAEASAAIPGRGVHHGRFEVMARDASEFADLGRLVWELGEPLAVRSSSPLEDDGTTAGAFTSFLGVAAAELGTAILGVWASALRRPDEYPTPGAQRAESAHMGVVIQRDVVPEFAGSASVTAGGCVRIVAVAGSAAQLMAGWLAGCSAVVDEDGVIEGPAALDLVGANVLREVAELARGVWTAMGDMTVEFAYSDGEVWLLQSRPPVAMFTPPAGPESLPSALPALALDPGAVVRALSAVGELAERLWLPWGLAGGSVPEFAPVKPRKLDDPLAIWSRLEGVAAALMRSVWRGPVEPMDIVGRLLHAVDGGGADLATELARCNRPTRHLVASFGRLCARLMAHLQAIGVVEDAVGFWSLPADLRDVLTNGRSGIGNTDRRRAAALKWEPLLYSAVTAGGTVRRGDPVAIGLGAGPAAVMDVYGFEERVERHGLRPRSILVAARPLPRYAPLLMGAAGLVTAGGSGAAHLIEVARSLGVPAVVGCRIDGIADRWSHVAVDGSTGDAHVLDARLHSLSDAQITSRIEPS